MTTIKFPCSVQKRIENELRPVTSTTVGFLLGKWYGESLHIFGCYRCPSDDVANLEHHLKDVAGQIPTGTIVCGLFCFYPSSISDDKVMREIRMTATRKFKEKCSSDHLIMAVFRESNGRKLLDSTFWYHADGREVSEADVEFTEENTVLEECVLFRLHGRVRITVGHSKYKDKVNQNIANELQKHMDQIKSNKTAFHVKHSPVILFVEEPPYARTVALTDDSPCKDIFQLIKADDDDDDEVGGKQKVKLKDLHKKVLHVNMVEQIGGPMEIDNVPNCSPFILHNQDSMKYMCVDLPLDVVCLIDPEEPVGNLAEMFAQGLINQMTSMGRCMCQFYRNDRLSKPRPYHFKPFPLGHIVTVLQPNGWSEEELESYRKELSQNLMLPRTRPLLRRSCKYVFPDEVYEDRYLRNTHVGLPQTGVKGGKMFIVDGIYAYHHYMQDRFDDNGWGCAYRSLQTIVSWFRHQGYTEVPVPSHSQIQQALVDLGDKEASFVGSRKWIGSTEVGYCLDHLLGVTSKFLFVSTGAELAQKGRELAMHFETQGTPIMIGGGVLAHTILGVDFNEVTGELKYLILDPHYTGGEDLKVIQDKGWCGWKGPDFWNQQAFYNLCMPQRPVCI